MEVAPFLFTKKEAVKKAPDPLCGKTLLGRVNIQQSAPPIVVTEDAGDDSKDDNGDYKLS